MADGSSGSAFPRHFTTCAVPTATRDSLSGGMTKREYAAVEIMAALLSGSESSCGAEVMVHAAEVAVAAADVLFSVLARR